MVTLDLSLILNSIIALLILVLVVLIYRRLVEDKTPPAATTSPTVRLVNPPAKVPEQEFHQDYHAKLEEHFIALMDERHELKRHEAEIRREHAQKLVSTRGANIQLKPLLARLAEIDSELKAQGIL
jgi:hypothetical protein